MSGSGGGSGGRPDGSDPFQELLDDARADVAARSRSVERWQRQRAEEGASFAGVLLDLGERGGVVTVTTEAGNDHRGRVVGVARDFVEVRTASARTVYVRLEAVAVLRPGGNADHGAASAERVGHHDRTLGEQLALLVVDRPRVTVVATADRAPLTGELRGVGSDVVTVRLDGPARDVAYVRTASLTEVVVHS